MPFAEVHLRLDLFRHTADPLPQIEVVRTLIEQHAAALAAPGRPPGTRIVIRLRTVPVGDDPACAANLAVVAALHQLAHLAVDAVCALVEHHTEHDIALFCDGVHRLDLLCIHAGGLFAHDVDALLHSFHRQRRVEIVRSRDDDRIHKAAVLHFGTGRKRGHVA